MRKIIQISFLLFVANVIITDSAAQLPKLPKVLVFANGTYANPSNADFKKISNYGLGFEVGAGVGLGKSILMASIGRMSYNISGPVMPGVFALSQPDKFKVTPVKLGLRRYLIAGLFINGALGLAINSERNFLYEAGAGFKLVFFEIGAAYTGYRLSNNFNANSLLLKAGLALKI